MGESEVDILRENILGGDSIIEAFEKCDLDNLRKQGERHLVIKIGMVLLLVDEILESIGAN